MELGGEVMQSSKFQDHTHTHTHTHTNYYAHQKDHHKVYLCSSYLIM